MSRMTNRKTDLVVEFDCDMTKREKLKQQIQYAVLDSLNLLCKDPKDSILPDELNSTINLFSPENDDQTIAAFIEQVADIIEKDLKGKIYD